VQDDRQLLNDVVNSLSSAPGPVRPGLIGGDSETYRIDLRDYELSDVDGPIVVGNTSFVDAWEAIKDNTQYGVRFQGDQAENVQLLTGTTVPLLFLDALVDGATTAGLPVQDADPLQAVLDTFSQDVDLDTAAGDVLFPPALFAQEINRLDPALRGLESGLSIERDDWSALYVDTLCIVTIANENRPADELCQ
jgi:hypothetical protein